MSAPQYTQYNGKSVKCHHCPSIIGFIHRKDKTFLPVELYIKRGKYFIKITDPASINGEQLYSGVVHNCILNQHNQEEAELRKIAWNTKISQIKEDIDGLHNRIKIERTKTNPNQIILSRLTTEAEKLSHMEHLQ